MAISYVEKDGKLWFFDKEEDFADKYNPAEIPSHIVNKGVIEIQKFCSLVVARHVKNKKRARARMQQMIKKPNLNYTFEYNGKTIKGRVVNANPAHFRLELQKPYRVEFWTSFNNFGAAMAGYQVFDDEGKFTTRIQDWCRQKLVEMFLKEEYKNKNASIIELAKRLNGQ